MVTPLPSGEPGSDHPLMLTDSPDFGLTKDEAQLLRLLATELSLADIGGLLRLPRDVVQANAQELYRRLGVSGNREPNGS